MARTTDRFSSAARPLIEVLEERQFMSAAPAPLAAAPAKPAAVATVFPLGGNLQEQSGQGSSLDHAFADLIKTSGGFRNLSGGAATTSPAGWPTQDFTVSVWDTAAYHVQVDPGTYNVSFNGPPGTTVALAGLQPGKPAPTLTKTGFNAATGVNTYAIAVPANVFQLSLRFTSTAGKVTNLKVLQPGSDLAKSPFNPKYIQLLTSLHPESLRLLDWNRINNNKIADWAQWPKVTDVRQNLSGVAWEYGIQLANQVGSALYICVPAHATNDFVTKLATLVRDQLNPNLRVYVEYSNEVWNRAFDQGQFNYDQAQAEVKANPKSNLRYDGTTNPDTIADRRTARRLKEIVDTFTSVWAQKGLPNPVNTARLRAVLGGQGVNLGRFDNMLGYINAVFGAPKQWFYGIGIAPYFAMNKYRDNFVNGQWQTLNDHLTVDQVLEGMGLSVSNYEKGVFSRSLAHGSPYGLKLIAYEGGVDTSGPFNIAAKKAAMLDPRFKTLVQRYLNAWYSQGGDVMDWFQLGARTFDSKSGDWAITNNLSDLNQPKEQVYRSFRGG